MNVDFHVDHFGIIWLHFAKDIWLREHNGWAKDHDELFS